MEKCKHLIGAHNLIFLLSIIFLLQLTTAKNLDSGIFANRLYNAVKEGFPPNKSFIIAPNTLRDNFIIFYLGASGATRSELHESLNLFGEKLTVAKYFYTPRSINVPKLSLSLSNVFFVSKEFDVGHILSALTKKFNLQKSFIDFHKSKEAAKIINGWIRRFTKKQISSLVDPSDLNVKTAGYLVNLIELNAVWKKRFQKIIKRRFYTGRTDFKVVNMLQQVNRFKYNRIRRLDAEVIELPFRKKLSMMILLPNLVENGLPDLERALMKEDLFRISKELNKTELLLEIPQLQLKSRIYLKRPLQRLGIKTAFTKSADFHKLFQANDNQNATFYLNNVVQETYINITASRVKSSAGMGDYLFSAQPRGVEFTVNRPFIFAIKDRKYIYMTGRYNL